MALRQACRLGSLRPRIGRWTALFCLFQRRQAALDGILFVTIIFPVRVLVQASICSYVQPVYIGASIQAIILWVLFRLYYCTTAFGYWASFPSYIYIYVPVQDLPVGSHCVASTNRVYNPLRSSSNEAALHLCTQDLSDERDEP